MLTFIRSFRLAMKIAVLLSAAGLSWQSERVTLWALAATAAFWGVVDWLGSNGEDRHTGR